MSNTALHYSVGQIICILNREKIQNVRSNLFMISSLL